MNIMLTKIKVKAKQCTTQNGRKFLSYSAKLGDEWFKIKFRRDCSRYPQEQGWWELNLNSDDVSLQKGDQFGDILWIKSIIEYSRLEFEHKPDHRVEEILSRPSIFDIHDTDDEIPL